MTGFLVIYVLWCKFCGVKCKMSLNFFLQFQVFLSLICKFYTKGENPSQHFHDMWKIWKWNITAFYVQPLASIFLQENTKNKLKNIHISLKHTIWKSGNGRRKKLLQLNSRKKWSVPAHLIIWHLLIILTSSMEITSSFSRSRYTKLSTKYIMGWCLHN